MQDKKVIFCTVLTRIVNGESCVIKSIQDAIKANLLCKTQLRQILSEKFSQIKAVLQNACLAALPLKNKIAKGNHP